MLVERWWRVRSLRPRLIQTRTVCVYVCTYMARMVLYKISGIRGVALNEPQVAFREIIGFASASEFVFFFRRKLS